MKKITRQLTFANVVACLALFVALGGASYAASKLPKNSVGTKQLKKGAVTAAKVKPHSLLAKDFKPGQLPRGANGATGAAGPNGPQGAVGAPGASAGSSTATLPHARIALLDANEPITSGGRQQVSFDTVVEDNAGMADLISRPGTLQVPRAGLYLVAGQLSWQGIEGSGRMGGTVQGAKNPAGSEYLKFRSVSTFDSVPKGLDYLDQPMSEVIRLSAGQYLALAAYQATGATNHLSFEDDGTWLEATYLGP
ncbi:MAG TPA: hypothetical protein VIJ21_09875 [Solirubrobacterales bacterium]